MLALRKQVSLINFRSSDLNSKFHDTQKEKKNANRKNFLPLINLPLCTSYCIKKQREIDRVSLVATLYHINGICKETNSWYLLLKTKNMAERSDTSIMGDGISVDSILDKMILIPCSIFLIQL